MERIKTLSPLFANEALSYSLSRARIVQQKLSSLCEKQISLKLLETKSRKVSFVNATLGSRSPFPLQLVEVTSERRGYVGISVLIGTVVLPNHSRQKISPAWVLGCRILYRTSKPNILRLICKRINLSFGLENSKSHLNDAWSQYTVKCVSCI